MATSSQTLTRMTAIAALAVSLGTGAPAQQVPEETRGTYGAWQVRCVPSTDQCVMAQTGKGPQGNDVIDVRIRKLKGVTAENGEAVPAIIQIAAPLGVLLQAGVRMQVDSHEQRAAPFEICSRSGCFVRQPVNDAFVKQMKAGNKANIKIVAAPNNQVSVDISLSGFTKAYNSLKP